MEPADDWKFNFYHKYLCDILQAEAIRVYKKQKRKHSYIINVPPSCTKSKIVSICFNAWAWGSVSPHLTFIVVANSEMLVSEFSTKTMELINSDWYQGVYGGSIQIPHGTSSKLNFKNNHGGSRFSIPIGGKITGLHGDIVIVDDAHDVKALSPAHLRNTIDSWLAISTRVKDQTVSAKIVLGQRVADGDITSFFALRHHALLNMGS